VWMPFEVIEVKASAAKDPDGRKLNSAVSAHLHLERARFKRIAHVHGLAVLSIPTWLVALWPESPPVHVRRLVLLGWAVSAFATVAAAVREWRWLARRDSHAADMRVDPGSGA
jgi:hypothetical protein